MAPSPTAIDWPAVIQAVAQLLVPLGIAELQRLEQTTINPVMLEAIKVAIQILTAIEPAPVAAAPYNPAHGRYQRGARPTPRHELAAAMPHRPTYREIASAPAKFFTLPSVMSPLGNDRWGNCVTAEQSASIMAYSIWGRGYAARKVYISTATTVGWARSHGVLNGAGLREVMTWNQTDALLGANGTGYLDGPHLAVDYTDDAAMRAAIVQGPVKLGVAASQLQGPVNASNDQSGWVLTGARTDQNIDHCPAAWSYGTFAELVALFTAAGFACSVPSGQDPSEPSYGMYTWGTQGIVSRSSLIAICGEAWLRTPTSPQITPTPTPQPTPAPTPSPVPVPPAPPVPAGYTGKITLDTSFFGRATLGFRDGVLISLQ